MSRIKFVITGLIVLYVFGALTYQSSFTEIYYGDGKTLHNVPDTLTTKEIPFNYTINELWRKRFLEGGFNRIHISDECRFAYFTTLKTASMTTRHLIDQDECGFGSRSKYPITSSQWKSCGIHQCGEDDFAKFNSSALMNLIFVRNPLSRFELLYNFVNTVSIRVPGVYSQHHQNRSVDFDGTDQSVPDSEVNFRRFVLYFHDWVIGKVEGLRGYERMHFQPTYHSSCIRMDGGIKCFRPDFVGHIETLPDDIGFMMSKLPTLATTWDGQLKRVNEGKEKRIERGTILKYEEEMLLLCKVYWNDFQCGHYRDEIPKKCVEANEKEWHQPTHCIDLNNQAIQWPDHRT